MTQGKSVPPEVALFLQDQLRQLMDGGMKPNELADRMGVTKGQISQLKNHAKGVGFKTMRGMGAILHMSFDQIEARSKAWGKEHADLVTAFSNEKVEYPERYPNRLLAAEFSRRSGVSEEAILSVVGWSLKAGEDPTPAEWFEDMKGEDRRLRRDAFDARVARGQHMASVRQQQLAKAKELAEAARGNIPAKDEKAEKAKDEPKSKKGEK